MARLCRYLRAARTPFRQWRSVGGADTAKVPLRLYALKHGDTFAVADGLGDICGNGDGLFP